jgi:hypothetical protein
MPSSNLTPKTLYIPVSLPEPMGFLSELFKRDSSDDPEPIITDPVLGKMSWSDDDEAWSGSYNGFNFLISYDLKARPDETVLAYARESLNDRAWLDGSLAEAKEKHKGEIGEKNRAFYGPEMDELTWETISFGRHIRGKHQGKLYIFASLASGRDYRAWRIEFVQRTCEGMGFDS